MLPGKGLEWMGIRHHEQDIDLPSKRGFFISCKKGLVPNNLLKCVNIKENFCVQVKKKPCMVCTIFMREFLGNILKVAKHY